MIIPSRPVRYDLLAYLFRSCVRLEFKILELSRIDCDGPIRRRVNLHVRTTSFAANVSFEGHGRVAQRNQGESQITKMAAERLAEEKDGREFTDG